MTQTFQSRSSAEWQKKKAEERRHSEFCIWLESNPSREEIDRQKGMKPPILSYGLEYWVQNH